MSEFCTLPPDPPACSFIAEQISAAARVLEDAIGAAHAAGNAPLAVTMAQPYALMLAAGNGLLLAPMPRSAAALVCVALRFALETQWQAFNEVREGPFTSAAHEMRRASGFLATTLNDIGCGHLLEVFRV